MKTLAFIFPLFITSAIVFAQETNTEDYFCEDKWWSLHSWYDQGYSWITQLYYIQGEKEIDGKIFKQVYHAWKEDRSDGSASFLLRQEGQKVYNGSGSLIFDFGAEKGDTVWRQTKFAENNTYAEGLYVENVYYRSFMDGKPARKCLDVSLRWEASGSDTMRFNGFQDCSDTWVEGFGSMRSGPASFVGDFSLYVEGGTFLLCVHQNGEQEYQVPYFTTCYVPAPEEGSVTGNVILVKAPQTPQSQETGKAFAVKNDSGTYMLRTYECFFVSDLSEFSYSPYNANVEEGDSVRVDGNISIQKDRNGNDYKQIFVKKMEVLPKSDTDMVAVQSTVAAPFTLYPNPARGSITIQSTGKVITEVRISDAAGRKMDVLRGIAQPTVNYYAGNLPKGLYVARVKSAGGETAALKFVVE